MAGRNGYGRGVHDRDAEAATFLFADLAGYTALTEAHGDEEAAELARRFCRAVSDAAAARGGEVLLTGAVRDAAGELAGVAFESRGEQRMRNVSATVPVFAAVADARSTEERDVDPVCRMVVAEGREAGSFRHRDALYRFCSLECARRFLSDPGAYVER